MDVIELSSSSPSPAPQSPKTGGTSTRFPNTVAPRRFPMSQRANHTVLADDVIILTDSDDDDDEPPMKERRIMDNPTRVFQKPSSLVALERRPFPMQLSGWPQSNQASGSQLPAEPPLKERRIIDNRVFQQPSSMVALEPHPFPPPLFGRPRPNQASGSQLPVEPSLHVRKIGASSSREKILLDSTNAPEAQNSTAASAATREPTPCDSLDTFLALVLEVMPDVEPGYARKLVEQNYPLYQANVVEHILHVLFEDPSYPKVVKNNLKRKRDEADEPDRAPVQVIQVVDYGSTNRPSIRSATYIDIALSQLFTDFPYIPKPYVRAKFFQLRALYAPTHLWLLDELKKPNPPFKRKIVPTRVTGKGSLHNDEFEQERSWLLQKLQEGTNTADDKLSEEQDTQEHEECGDGIECGCCFTNYPFDKMVQCPEAHLFCTECMVSYVSNQLGQHDPKIKCMDQSGCKLLFPDSELARFLTPKLLSLYHRVKQTKEIEAAALDGLEECPFCEYKVVIENADEKLFRCESDECGVVSCRSCKKADHLPRSCKEADDDKCLDARHNIEEAMTKALMRNCPKCKKPFVKEMGCNKMTCPYCHTLSCYICRKVIDGYGHFDQAPPYNAGRDRKKCPLWDSNEQQRSDQEVAAAAKKALDEYRLAHPDVDEKSIAVDLPKTAKPAGVAPAGPVAGFPPGHAPPPYALHMAGHYHVHGHPVVAGRAFPAPPAVVIQRQPAHLLQQHLAALAHARLVQRLGHPHG